MPSKEPEPAWYNYLTVDLLARVLERSAFHPFVAWMIPLCFRAVGTSFEHRSMRLSAAYATLVSIYALLSLANKRIAYGAPRKVDLAKEVIVITGGASGLGALIAEVYGMRGASVAVLDVQGLEEEEIARGVEFYKCDVGEKAQVEKVAAEIEEELGTPTILINNAGIVNGKPLLELSSEDIERNFRVNLLSHYHTIQTFLPGMIRKQRGSIVTVSSVLGHLGCKNLSDYTAAKAGLIALHASLTAEIAPYPSIKTLLVTPGKIATPLFEGVEQPSHFLSPVLSPVDIAKEIIAALDAGEGGEIALPLYARWIRIMGMLPVGIQNLIRGWALDSAMDTFKGKRIEGDKAGVVTES
ncbi:MAG: hypothetical protein M1833_002732 [Piccolia ochrophora]|nr:MAG: hypothetical protein M1833_002732 [Piccolia ochrophora]